MKTKVHCLLVAATMLLLTACTGSSADEASVASRLARAATRTVVDAVIEVDNRTSSEEGQASLTEPLQLAASRPNSILENAIEAVDPDAALLDADAEPRHVVIATAIPRFTKKCSGGVRFEGDSLISKESRTSRVASPLTRARAGSLTRI